MKTTYCVRVEESFIDLLDESAKAMNMPTPDFVRTVLELSTGEYIHDLEKAFSEFIEIRQVAEQALAVVAAQNEIYADLKARSTDLARVSVSVLRKGDVGG